MFYFIERVNSYPGNFTRGIPLVIFTGTVTGELADNPVQHLCQIAVVQGRCRRPGYPHQILPSGRDLKEIPYIVLQWRHRSGTPPVRRVATLAEHPVMELGALPIHLFGQSAHGQAQPKCPKRYFHVSSNATPTTMAVEQ